VRVFLRRGASWLVLGAVWLLLAAPAGPPAYNRALWGGWTTEDCRDTRTRVLLRDAEPESILWRDGTGPEGAPVECEIAYGVWRDWYTGQVYRGDPSGLDIDHVVSLRDSHQAGGWAWNPARRRAFANELGYRSHLVVTKAEVNRAKGEQGPDRWRPPDRRRWCDYSVSYAAIKFRWRLSGSEAERLAVGEMMKTCLDPTAPTLFDR